MLVLLPLSYFRTITGDFVLSIYFKLGDKYDIGINFVRVASVFHIYVKISFVLGMWVKLLISSVTKTKMTFNL